MRTAIMIFSFTMSCLTFIMTFVYHIDDRKGRGVWFIAFIAFLATFSLAAGGVIG